MPHTSALYRRNLVEANNEVGAKYFTHPSSYYPVPHTGMSFKDVRFMTPLTPEELSKGKEQTMKDWLENYRPVR